MSTRDRLVKADQRVVSPVGNPTDAATLSFEKYFRGHRIHALPPKGGSRTWNPPEGATEWSALAQTWMKRQRDCKFYFSPADIKPGCLTTTKDDMLASQWVWADLDPRDDMPLEQERMSMLALLTSELPKGVPVPTFVVDSGRGYWGFWRLEIPHMFDGRLGGATRAFEDVLRGLGKAFGVFGDNSVKNTNRIARLPGSVNTKTGETAKVLVRNSVRYKLADFPVIHTERAKPRERIGEPIPLDLFKRMLAVTPYTGGPDGLNDRHSDDGWINFVAAAHEAARGDCTDYLEAFIEWCQNDPNAKETWTAEAIQGRWESFDCDAEGGVTRASWTTLLSYLCEDDLVSEATPDDGGLEQFKEDKPEPDPKQDAIDKRKAQLKETFGFEVINAGKVKRRNIDWIWYGHLAKGQHTMIAGVQGDGKSQLVYNLAAAVTKGSAWPGTKQRAPQGRVIVFSAEDTIEDVLTPRLAAAGANLDMIEIVKATVDKGKERKFNMQADIANLTKLTNSYGDVVLITFDPVTSYLGGTIDSHSNTELRNALDPITAMAAATGAAVISVSHFTKATKGVKALNAVMGGAAFTAAPRAAFAVIRDANDDDARLFLSLKGNLASKGSAYGMTFHIEVGDGGVDDRDKTEIKAPFVVWDDVTEITADEALAATQIDARKSKGGPALREARDFLREELADGWRLVSEIKTEAKEQDIAPQTLRTAREELGVLKMKQPQADGHGPWLWSLPTAESEAAKEFSPPGGYTLDGKPITDEPRPWE